MEIEKQMEVKDGKLYCGQKEHFVSYDKKNDSILVFSMINYGKYTVGIKYDGFTVPQEENQTFLDFCRHHNIATNSKAYDY